jgi:hypothetical protein
MGYAPPANPNSLDVRLVYETTKIFSTSKNSAVVVAYVGFFLQLLHLHIPYTSSHGPVLDSTASGGAARDGNSSSLRCYDQNAIAVVMQCASHVQQAGRALQSLLRIARPEVKFCALHAIKVC